MNDLNIIYILAIKNFLFNQSLISLILISQKFLLKKDSFSFLNY